MNVPSYSWGSSTRGLGTLIAVLMRYPEVSSVQYNPEHDTLSVNFVIRKQLSGETWNDTWQQLEEVLETYRHVTGRPLKTIELDSSQLDTVTSVELTRDVATLSVEEIGMAIEVLREIFEGEVLADQHDLLEEEMMVQEETIQERLEAIKRGASGHLIAMRDEGRVVVFNT